MAETPVAYFSVLGEGIRDRCMDAANRVLHQIDDDLDESIIPVPPLRLRSRGAGSDGRRHQVETTQCPRVNSPTQAPIFAKTLANLQSGPRQARFYS